MENLKQVNDTVLSRRRERERRKMGREYKTNKAKETRVLPGSLEDKTK